MNDRTERNRRIAQAWRDGAKVAQIARDHGLSPSWTGQLLRRLGVTMPTTGQGIKIHLDDAAVERQYVAGLSVRAIAESRGVSYGKIYRLLLARGVSMRPRGGRYG